jgi:hypothetical protein
MGRRRQQRFKKNLAVQIHGTDSLGRPFSQTASVMDVSETGVRLQGVHVLYRPGQTAVLEHNGKKAQYRVVWIGGDALAGQAGLVNLEPEKAIFNLRFPPSGPDKYVMPPPEVREFQDSFRQFDDGLRRLVEHRRRAEKRKEERRRFPRFSVRGDAEIFVEGTNFAVRGKLTDLSRSGCFVELLPGITLGAHVALVLLLAHRQIHVQGVVRSVLSSFGLGIEFEHIEAEDLQMLEEVLAEFEHGTPQENDSSPAPLPSPSAATQAIDPQRALDAVKSWFGDHDFLSRQEFLVLLKKSKQ